MIIRKTAAKSRLLRFGCSGDSVAVPPETLNALLYFLPPRLERPLSALPVQCRQLARVAMIASPRVHDGFAWHNACYELTPANWQAVLRLTRPDYLLVESCLYDSARAWNLHAFDSAAYATQFRTLAEAARTAGVASEAGGTFVMGFPFESIESDVQRDRLMRDVLVFLLKQKDR